MKLTEVNSGWRKLLTKGLVYRLVQFVFSEKRSKALILKDFINPLNGNCSVLDIGCGPGNLANFLPENSRYTGFDVSEEYIKSASNEFAERKNVTFICASTTEMMSEQLIDDNSFDVAIVHGVFHHVTDEIASQMFKLASKKLKVGGKMLVLEPVWFDNQSIIRKRVMQLDRGKNIKTYDDWVKFFEQSTNQWATNTISIEQNLIRFYDLIVGTFIKK